MRKIRIPIEHVSKKLAALRQQRSAANSVQALADGDPSNCNDFFANCCGCCAGCECVCEGYDTVGVGVNSYTNIPLPVDAIIPADDDRGDPAFPRYKVQNSLMICLDAGCGDYTIKLSNYSFFHFGTLANSPHYDSSPLFLGIQPLTDCVPGSFITFDIAEMTGGHSMEVLSYYSPPNPDVLAIHVSAGANCTPFLLTYYFEWYSFDAEPDLKVSFDLTVTHNDCVEVTCCPGVFLPQTLTVTTPVGSHSMMYSNSIGGWVSYPPTGFPDYPGYLPICDLGDGRIGYTRLTMSKSCSLNAGWDGNVCFGWEARNTVVTCEPFSLSTEIRFQATGHVGPCSPCCPCNPVDDEGGTYDYWLPIIVTE